MTAKIGLLVIDLQNDYFPGGPVALHNIEAAADNAARVLQAFRKKGLPLVHVQHVNEDPSFGFFLRGTPGADLHEKVKPLEGESVVVKAKVNSFLGTNLHELLQEAGVDTLIVCGAMTHMCVDSGVRAAADLGYKCVVPGDACATRDVQFNDTVVKASDVHTAYLAALKDGAFANVVSTTEEALNIIS